MPILIEVNSGREPQKSGVLPEDVTHLAQSMSTLSNVDCWADDYGRPSATPKPPAHILLLHAKSSTNSNREIPRCHAVPLDGHDNSYKVALQEGANIIRLGTLIFGQR